MTVIPWISKTFKHVLAPPGMKESGTGTPECQWYINDHCIFADRKGRLHWFGITNPYPSDNNFYGPGTHRHIGHAVADHPFGPWHAREHAFELPPESPENIGACFVVEDKDAYLMIYTRGSAGFCFAQSSDLDHWEDLPDQTNLDMGNGTRDSCVLRLDDGTYLLYAAAGRDGLSAVMLASSRGPEPLDIPAAGPADRCPIWMRCPGIVVCALPRR